MKTALLILTLLVMAACGGKGTTTTSSKSSSIAQTTGPTLSLADNYNLDENKQFSLSIQAVGTGPFRYKLIYTPDTALFTLDENTGQLKSKSSFDYENPLNDKTNVYQLSLLVTDAANKSVAKDFKIQILNKSEYEIAVDFPIEDANAGGTHDKIHVRGHITEDGKTLEKIPPSLIISVNGKVAAIDKQDPRSWIVEIPISLGKNNITLQAASNNLIEHQKTIQLSNTPILNQEIADNNSQFIIGFDTNRKTIFKKMIADESQISVIASTNQSLFSKCLNFSNMELNRSGNKLGFICHTQDPNYNLVVCNIENNACTSLGGFKAEHYAYKLRWLDDKHIAFSEDWNQFILMDTETGRKKSLIIKSPDENWFATDFEISDYVLYIQTLTNENPKYKFYAYNLLPSINNNYSQQQIGRNTLPDQDVSTFSDEGLSPIINGRIYMPTHDGLNVSDLDGQNKNSIKIPGLPIYSNNINPIITRQFESVLQLRVGRTLLNYNLDNRALKVSSGPIIYPTDFEINLKENKLFLFDGNTHQHTAYNLATNLTDSIHKIPSTNASTTVQEGWISYDWQQQIVYQQKIYSWSGALATDEPQIVAHDLKNNTSLPVLTGYQFAAYLNLNNLKLTMGHSALNPLKSELWFVALSWYTDQAGAEIFKQGIYSLNLQTKALRTIKEYQNLTGNNSFPFISRYNSGLDAVIVGNYGHTTELGGGIDLVNGKGETKNLLSPLSPYAVTIDGDIDPEGRTIFNGGFLPTENDGYPDFSKGEIFSIDIATRAKKIIASSSIGFGPTPLFGYYKYDANRDILLSLNYYGIFIVDSVTGDRVIKSLKFSE